MAREIPCPGPGCKLRLRFDPSVAGKIVVCPGCGTKIRVPPENKLQDSKGDPFALPDELSPATLRRTTARPSWPWSRWGVVGLLAVTGLGLLLLYWQPSRRSSNPLVLSAGGTEVRLSQVNCRFLVPGDDWEPDPERRKELHAVLALRQRNSGAWLALLAEPRKGNPTDEELWAQLLDLLTTRFGDALEWQRADPVAWLGMNASRIQMRIDQDNTSTWGEVVWMQEGGVFYALIVGVPASDPNAARTLTAQLQARLTLLKADKEQSTRAKSTIRRFRGQRLAYVLDDGSNRWEEWQPATDFDPWADLALVLREGSGSRGTRERTAGILGTILVLLPPDRVTDPTKALEQAQRHLEEQQKKDYPETTVRLVKEHDSGSGMPRRLEVRNGESRQRLVLLRTAAWPKGIMILQAECDWRDREALEPALLSLMQGLRFDALEEEKPPGSTP